MKHTFAQLPQSSSYLPLAQLALKKVLSYQHVGFHKLPQREDLWQALGRLSEAWRGRFDQIAVVGIGGSSLGPQVIAECMGFENILFFENLDGLHFQRLVNKIKNPNRTAWIFSSKSGATIETLATIEALDSHFKQKGQGLGTLGVVISEPVQNPLTEWGKKKGYEFLEIPLDVGGRFSVLTAVGLLPAALAGASLDSFREGARHALSEHDFLEKAVAQTLLSYQKNQNITVFWFYTSCAISMGRWVQQLWAESLGKKTTRQGQKSPMTSTPVLAMGSVDQHSTLQQMMEGNLDKSFWFFRFSDVEAVGPLEIQNFSTLNYLKGKKMGDLIAAQAEGTEKALQERGALTLQVQYPELNAQCLGHFFMTMELVVATLAEALDLNAFDQPGVERGKILTQNILLNQKDPNR